MSASLMWVLPVAGGYLLDLLLGDPVWLYHPVRHIGRLITALEKLLRRLVPETPAALRIAGMALALAVPIATAGITALLLWIARQMGFYLLMAAKVWLCYRLIAARALQKESLAVYDKLKEKDIPGARFALSRIVGRDTDELDVEGVTKAAVETVAENASDGVIAPLFYLLIGGPIAGWAYKAVNTLDSMVGYTNDRYRYLGTASAKLDDLLNYIPARLSALFFVAAAPTCGGNVQGAWRIWRRDRRNHPSPNSAQTEAACAGALEIQLAGGASYGGIWKEKPTIGDPVRPVEPEDIPRACRMMQMASLLALAVFSLARFVIFH